MTMQRPDLEAKARHDMQRGQAQAPKPRGKAMQMNTVNMPNLVSTCQCHVSTHKSGMVN